MKKIFSKFWENILFISTLFLLVLIPLYPKIPIVDVRNTWVYVRLEDFFVVFVIFLWVFLLIKKKVTLKTPLTLPIFIFWIIGAIATIHGVIIIFPEAANVFPNVAFLTYIRHFEYLSLFFAAYSSIKSKKSLYIIVYALIFTFILVVLYGFGQKYLGFPAYLTMNEQFAKGVPITLSRLSRVPSTFAGHYDLAAYLVLMIPILAGLVFGFKNWFAKIALSILVILGFSLLFMTVSRISFVVLFASLFIVLFFHNKKLVLLSIPILALLIFAFVSFQSALFMRFGSTVKEVNVLVDTKTGNAIGHIKFVPISRYVNKTLKQLNIGEDGKIITEPINKGDYLKASPSSFLTLDKLPSEVPLVSDVNLSTGENLPQGTGYVNLALSPVLKQFSYFFYEKTKDKDASQSSQAYIFRGNFLVKRVAAYDLSFTTRFQGEWPHAIEAFKKNLLFGSGYGSVSLAVDNNYLRMLGETGLLGTAAFLLFFLILGIYVRKIFPNIESQFAKSFMVGFCAGLVGLSFNAMFIDVFEASKIAFLLWMLMGFAFGILVLYQKEKINLYEKLKHAAVSTYAVIFYILTLTVFIFSPMINNFFVGDDFTWLRWASECSDRVDSLTNCLSPLAKIFDYFTQANGFFYRPGTKVYFYLIDSAFWFNQVVYHVVSIFAHFAVVVLFFFLAKKILKNLYLSILACLLFLLMSGYSETVFWISSTGYLFNALLILLSLLLFIEWEEKRKNIFYILSLISSMAALFFHELGVIAPFLIILHSLTKEENLSFKKLYNDLRYFFLFSPIIVYLILRYNAHSHWFNGDYSYNLLKLPFNTIGNTLGYILLVLFGPISLPLYEAIRNFFRENIVIASIFSLAALATSFLIVRLTSKEFDKREKKIIVFGFLFFIISLAPFLGLGNITSRYSYLASLGLIPIFIILIKKLYIYLQSYGKEIAISGIFIIISVFSLWHIIQVQQIIGDWNGAGVRTNNFLASINGLYTNFWSTEPVELHFVNVPTKSGEAWVFPVGLDDAIWLAFKSPSIKIFRHNDLRSTLDQVGSSYLKPIFVFQDDGSLKEVFPPKKAVPVDSNNKSLQ